jgi:Fur family ferric uptake transcriptional regulator
MVETGGDSEEIRALGLKATNPRLRILELFRTSERRHLSADEVHRSLAREGNDVGLATVYRVLTQFAEGGLLERHQFESGKSVYELKANEHHDHLVCATCGHVEEFYDETLERRQHKIAKDHGYALRGHALYLFVDCLDEHCPRRRSSPASAD